MIDDEFEYQLISKDEKPVGVLLLASFGVFYRNNREWIPLTPGATDFPYELEQLDFGDADAHHVEIWDQIEDGVSNLQL